MVKQVVKTKQKMSRCTLHLNLDFYFFNIPSKNLLRHIWATFFFRKFIQTKQFLQKLIYSQVLNNWGSGGRGVGANNLGRGRVWVQIIGGCNFAYIIKREVGKIKKYENKSFFFTVHRTKSNIYWVLLLF